METRDPRPIEKNGSLNGLQCVAYYVNYRDRYVTEPFLLLNEFG